MKYYELKPWDKANHWWEILTFVKIDWMYAVWDDENWNMKVWHSFEYELKDWIYYPVNN